MAMSLFVETVIVIMSDNWLRRIARRGAIVAVRHRFLSYRGGIPIAAAAFERTPKRHWQVRLELQYEAVRNYRVKRIVE